MGVIIVVSGVFVASSVNAQDLESSGNTFFSRLAEKLDLEEEEIVEVVDGLREDMQAQRQAQRAETITQAIEDGKLTEKQIQILDAMEDLKPTGKPEDWEEWKEYTPEQREALRETRRETRENEMRDALYNDFGLEVTQEEMVELHQIMSDEGIGMYGQRGEKGMMGGGMRGGIGGGNGECNE